MSEKYAYAPAELQALGQMMRARILRHTVPGLPEMRDAVGLTPVPRTIPAVRGLTQQDVSAMLAWQLRDSPAAVPATYYARLERGLIGRPPIEILNALVEVLQMDPVLWTELWLRLRGRPPSGEEGLLPAAQLPRIWGDVVRAGLWQPPAGDEYTAWGLYVAMETWDVVRQTPSVARLWGRPIHNAIESVLTDHLARADVMIDWEYWAGHAISRLAAALRDHPTNTRLQRIRTAVLLDPAVSALWDLHAARPAPQHISAPRRMRHAATGIPGTLTTGTATIQDAPGYTVIIWRWTAD